MPELPEEVWKIIFEYLNGRDIINLTRVSRYFCEIINKTSSLSSKLTLCFRKRKYYGRIGRRTYRKLAVDYIDPTIHYNILRFIGKDITELVFGYQNFTLDSIRQILMLCSKIKILKFNKIDHLHGTKEVTACSKIPNYKNIELHVEQCDPRIFKVLKNVQAFKVHITCCEFAHRQYFVDLVNFLGSQVDLVELTLSEFMGPIVGLGLVLFSSDHLCSSRFRLKKLHLMNNQLIPYGNISSVQFFMTFMDLHKETLEELEGDSMQDFDFSPYIAECKVLKRISIGVDMKLSSRIVVPTVQSLRTEHVRMNLVKSFPNLKELQLLNSWYDPSDDIVKWSILTSSKFLEKLEVEDVPLDDFPSLPTLKSIKFKFYPNIESEVFARNPQIEELTFIECRDMWSRKSKVLKIIIDYMKNLESLKIVSSRKIDKSALEYVKNKCSKLKYFNIYKDVDCHVMWV